MYGRIELPRSWMKKKPKTTHVFVVEPFEHCTECLQFPLSPVHFVSAAEAEFVEPDVFAVLVVSCESSNVVTSHVNNVGLP